MSTPRQNRNRPLKLESVLQVTIQHQSWVVVLSGFGVDSTQALGKHAIRPSGVCGGRLTEGRDGRRFIIKNVEHGVEFCNLHHFENLFREVQEFHFSPLLPDTCQRTEQEAQEAMERVNRWMEENELELHPGKTVICNCAMKGQGFEFLGFRFELKTRL